VGFILFFIIRVVGQGWFWVLPSPFATPHQRIIKADFMSFSVSFFEKGFAKRGLDSLVVILRIFYTQGRSITCTKFDYNMPSSSTVILEFQIFSILLSMVYWLISSTMSSQKATYRKVRTACRSSVKRRI
jgi:hypothetical protein